MANYSKLIGSLIGGLVGMAAAFGVNVEWLTPDLQATIATLIGSLIGTFIAPANRAV